MPLISENLVTIPKNILLDMAFTKEQVKMILIMDVP